MGLADVNHDELHLIMILPMEITETHGPLGERRSSKTPKNQGDGAHVMEIRQPDMMFPGDIEKLEIWRFLTNLWRCGVVLCLPVIELFSVMECLLHEIDRHGYSP